MPVRAGAAAVPAPAYPDSPSDRTPAGPPRSLRTIKPADLGVGRFGGGAGDVVAFAAGLDVAGHHLGDGDFEAQILGLHARH